jgi:transposase-like protein
MESNSKFCAMLEKEEHRDADSWSVHLLDLIDRGFQPDINISDQVAGIKKAFADTLPETELRFDHV